MMKKLRQDKMMELISRYDIETQDELITRLRECGFPVTQATVSRDIRELKIVKLTAGKGKYRYALPTHNEGKTNIKLHGALVDSILSVDHACNTIVLKTLPGMAQALAVGIDHMNLPQILGCVAGDDTILVVVRDAEAASDIAVSIHDLLKSL